MSTLSKAKTYEKVSFSPTAKLPLIDKILYAAGSGLGTNIAWVAFGYYLMYFYTDVLGISAVLAGTIILGARFFDAFTDVLMGWAVDRFNLPWGKYRSWIILSIAPITLLFIGVFTAIPGFSMTAKVIWSVVTYGAYGSIGATLCLIPMTSQITNMTKNVEERATVAGITTIFLNGGQVIVSSLMMPMVNLFGGSSGNMKQGFFWTSVVIALFSMLTLLGVVGVTKKYELNADGTPRPHLVSTEHEPVVRQVKNIVQNRPAVVLVIGVAFQYILQAIRNGSLIYVFNYYLNLPDFQPMAMFVTTVAMVVGAMLLKPVIHFVKDANRAFLITMALSVVFTMLFWFMCKGMGPSAAAASMKYGALFFVFTVNGLLTGLHYSFVLVLLPNVVEYGAWKTGQYQPGMIYALHAICLTVGGAIGAQLMGGLLDMVGYVPNQAQTATALSGLLIVAFVIPAVFTLAQLIVQLFFGLSDKQVSRYAEENQARSSARQTVEHELSQAD